jgi:hypothetical protein
VTRAPSGVWDTVEGKRISTIREQAGEVVARATFSDDNRLVV